MGAHIRAKYALATLLETDRIDRAVTKTPHDPEQARVLLEEATSEQDPYAMHRSRQAAASEWANRKRKEARF